MHEHPEPASVHPLSHPSCAALLRALGDETRLALIRTLLGGGRSVTDLCQTLGLPQSLTSRHLGILRGMGLVLAHRHAQRVVYEVAPELRARISGKTGAASQRLDLGCCEVRFR